MKKHNEKHTKKVRNLVAFCSLCAILLSVSTYAWFIGMTKVNVSAFEINVATTEGLFLSMDGENWSYNLDAYNATAYENNANVWANTSDNKGLIPMSTVGDMDATSSRMKLFEKASYTSVPGGYRLLASRVDNYTNKNETSGEYIEGKGYVAFDLFVKNLSGTEYYVNNDPENEEAIYLRDNSTVKVSTAGGDEAGKEGAGIENSVRVAFVQLGRVNANTTDVGTITGINCAGGEGVTGICRDAQIWEPNDTKHETNALNWYNTSCAVRTGANSNQAASYNLEEDCVTLENGTAYPTYSVSKEIEISDYVNAYDGTAFNKYAANTKTYAEYLADNKVGKLVDFPYFTDTTKEKNGNERVQFMTLAPNSITKLRVYIYIEGQDIDNYDFAQLGKKITVNFGFTKERFDGSEIGDTVHDDITPTGTATVAQ